MKNSFVLYTDYKQHIDLLSTEEKAQLLDAIFDYAEGKKVELEGAAMMAFSFIKAQLDRDGEKYEKTCEARKEAGSKGGKAKVANAKLAKQNKQSLANQADNDTDNDNDNDTDTDNDKNINYQLIADMYNDTCVSFPKLTKLSESRKKAIRARLKKYSVDDIKRAFRLAEESDFLKGGNTRNWSANFDWLMNDTNLAKVLDGNYRNKSPSGKIEIDPKFREAMRSSEVVNFGI